MNKPINIGFGNVVLSSRVVAVVSNESSPIKRIIQEARERGGLIDTTHGRRTRSVIFTDSDYIIISSLLPETIANRIAAKDFTQSLQTSQTSEPPEDEEEATD